MAATGIGLLIGGLIVIGEIIAIATTLALYAEGQQKMHDLVVQLNALNAEVAQLHIIESQVTGLQKNTKTVVDTSAQVADGWLALAADITNTMKQLEKITPEQAAILINTELGAANKDWAVVLTQAEALQPKGGKLESKKYETADEMVKAIKDSAKQGA